MTEDDALEAIYEGQRATPSERNAKKLRARTANARLFRSKETPKWKRQLRASKPRE
jgi:hypothetical protein